MYLSLASGSIPFVLSLFLIVDVYITPDTIVPAMTAPAGSSLLLPVLLSVIVVALLYYNWCLRRKITHINRTGKALATARLNMIDNLSQQVRTPLNAIVGFSEQLSYTTLDGNQRELLSAVESAANALIRIQQDIQELGWLQQGRLHLENDPFSPYKIFNAVTENLSSLAHSKQLQFEVDYSGDRELEVSGDGKRLQRIIYCLVDNAIKYTTFGSVRCQMSVEQLAGDDVQVNIRIQDTGCGIPAERLPFIFDQYLHHAGGDTATVQGAGLGLALAQALVHLHLGSLTVQSTPGEGSRFSCSISYKAVPPPQTIIVSREEISRETGQYMKDRYILVADDQEMNLVLMAKILTRWQCRFDRAPDGAAAYQLFVSNRYDMVLLDLQMPHMTGIEVVKKIREDKDPAKARMPVLALTSDATIPGSQEFIDAGFDGYLLKPFREKEIYNIIIRHLHPFAKDGLINSTR